MRPNDMAVHEALTRRDQAKTDHLARVRKRHAAGHATDGELREAEREHQEAQAETKGHEQEHGPFGELHRRVID